MKTTRFTGILSWNPTKMPTTYQSFSGSGAAQNSGLAQWVQQTPHLSSQTVRHTKKKNRPRNQSWVKFPPLDATEEGSKNEQGPNTLTFISIM